MWKYNDINLTKENDNKDKRDKEEYNICWDREDSWKKDEKSITE